VHHPLPLHRLTACGSRLGALISPAWPRNCQPQTVDGKLFPVATFYIQQFGCRATQADGAALERQLLNRGSTAAASAEAADVVVLNTCTVTSAADAQARDAIRKIHAANPATRIVVTGCYAQRAPEELAVLPGVFHVVGNSHKPQIPDLLVPAPDRGTARDFVPAGTLLAPILSGDIFELRSLLVAPVLGGEGNHTRPTLKIQDGCNNRCAFCVIPFVRGGSRSLPPEAVVEEVRRLSEAGYKEIVLSGINLGAWGRDLSPRRDFKGLLKKILDETGVERLRLSSIEPLDASRDLILLFASTPRLAEHFHMPLQSGSDRILAAMHRWYRGEHYARRIEIIREHLPNAAIGADVIAGFPGETGEDHAATLDFLERRPFTYLHVFSYSSRPGTPAAALPNHVPPKVVKERARELRALGEAKSACFYRSQSGRILRVLTLRHADGRIPDSTEWTPALSTNYLKVRIFGAWPPNQFVNAVAPSSPQAIVSPALEESFAAI
jgi:threonylcarbamoyladenosine tRNA methylthiotransferase MtaB